jgi:hypothetical protein
VPVRERDQKAVASHYVEQVGGPVPVALAATSGLGANEPPLFPPVVGDDADNAGIRVWLSEAGHATSSVHGCPTPPLVLQFE